MRANYITGINAVAAESDSRKASIHAGLTGLTGLTGVARMCVCISVQRAAALEISLMRAKKNMLTLITLLRASVHAGFDVTGVELNHVSRRKGAQL
jgi:hypothetical protein